jgi:hypothetical protein
MTDNQRVIFDFTASRRQVHTFLKALVLINLLFLAGTWAQHTGFFQFRKPTANLIMAQFNFGKENVLASWYSSMLFMLTGLVALFCCWADWVRSADNKGRALSMGWLVMAGIFVLLSYDEMGSFHEMIGETSVFKTAGSGKRAGWYAFYALCGGVAVFMILFFFYRFRKNRLTLLLTIIGVLFFASNPIQEKFEIHSWRSSADPSTWKRPVMYLLLEEGSEIFASFCFLFSFLTYAMGASISGGREGIRLQARLGRMVPVVLAGLLLLLGLVKLLIHFNAWNFSHDDNGIPRNWPPAVLFFVAFLAAAWLFQTAEKTRKVPAGLIAVTALCTSIYFGANMYGYYGHAYDRNVFGLLPYAMLALTTAAVVLAAIRPGSLLVKCCWGAWLAGMACSVMFRQSTPQLLTTLAGYGAACCLLAGLYLQFVSGSSRISPSR